MDSWSCLMVEKGPGIITDDIRASLKLAACDLALRKCDRLPIDTEACDGIIQTEWKTYSVGSTSGVLFRAQVTEETGDYFVNFLLNEDDLKRGADLIREMREGPGRSWGKSPTRFPVPELYEFYDLRKHKLN
jgi:hypothetical protein